MKQRHRKHVSCKVCCLATSVSQQQLPAISVRSYLMTKLRCGRCSFWLGGKPAKARSFVQEQVTIDKIKPVLDEIPNKDNPRFLARVAVGVHSHKVRHGGLHLRPVFGSTKNADLK